MMLEEFLEHLDGVHRNYNGSYSAKCPAHDDNRQSLTLDEAGDERFDFTIYCHAGCSTGEIFSAMGIKGKWPIWTDSRPEWGEAQIRAEAVKRNSQPEAEYVYTDEKGTLLYKVVRYPGKRFRHERRHVPYRLPKLLEVLPDQPVYIVEGEKDVHALERCGRVATCNAGGAGSWKEEWAPIFARANVIIWADKDRLPETPWEEMTWDQKVASPGLRHAFSVADSLYRHALTIKVVQSYVGKDAYDHLEAGYGPDDYELIRVVKGPETRSQSLTGHVVTDLPGCGWPEVA